jgi:hypothetical protein
VDSFKCGAVAQLGERLLCKQEVIGSIPFSSTSSCRRRVLVDLCRKKEIENEFEGVKPLACSLAV